MKKNLNLTRPVILVAAITVLILFVPLIAMQFNAGVQWSFFDFVIMGVLIFFTGLAYILITRFSSNVIYKLAFALAIISTFLLIWVNLAVGLIGSGPNAANLMYAGLTAMIIIGSTLSRFTSKGMQQVMLTAVLLLGLFVLIQLALNAQNYPDSSMQEIIMVNSFFAVLFGASALLFHFSARRQMAAGNE